ncbi:hypothetical protein WCE10_16345 [Cronobacter muytjensii]|uniref:hypothetical protein n=1 Tax=Cronobacter muytjensii TaxID=413501 RepID=UPI0034D394B5
MPVDLKKIPKQEPLPIPPDKTRWLVVIVLCVTGGAVLVLSFWPAGLSAHSAWFWFCTLIMPFLTGLSGFIIRTRNYENERDRVLWWNHLHREQYEKRILLGRQAVGVLGMSYVTPVASNKLAAALLRGGNTRHTQYSPVLQSVLTTATLTPPLKTFSERGYRSRLESMLTSVIRQLHTELAQFTGKLSVRLHHDGTLENEQIIMAWQAVFLASYSVSDISASTDNGGLMWIDEWLDRQDETLVLSIEINLFLQARDQQAESVSAVLLASPAWLERQHVKPCAWIHRPVTMKDADESVADVAHWGGIAPGLPWYFWRTQVKSDTLAVVLQAMDKSGYLSARKGEQVLDDTFGRPGTAVGNIPLICASEHAIATGQVQWLLIGDRTAQMIVVRPA